MAHLPPVGWADVATKHDLDALAARVDLRFEGLESKLLATESKLLATFRAELRAELLVQTRTMVFSLVGAVFTAVSLTFAAVRLG